MKMSMLLVLTMMAVSVSWITAQDSPCVQCCDYQPTTTPGVFSVIRGEKGDTGEPGIRGQMGKAGPKGDRGFDGEKGALGYPGLQGEKGSNGEKGAEGNPGMQGVRGLRGEQGFQGYKGQKGERYNFQNWPAFSVARNSRVEGQSSHITMTYDYTFVNNGNDMNINTGIFTCHTPGIYFFTFTTLKQNNKYVAAFIMVNSQTKARIYADNKDWQGMVSQSITVSLNNGNTVWVRVDKHSEYQNVMLDSNDKHHTTFNGHLVNPTT
ncbi:complement C1q tumor necrosis factor-related protein 1-like [Glandiceps talaboti]